MTLENEIFTSQVRSSNGTTLDLILTSLENAANLAANAPNNVMVSCNDGSTIANVGLNFVNTANIKIIVTSDGNSPGGNANVAIYGSAGNPGGSNTQIQFANNGPFGGSPNLVFNVTSNTLSCNGPFFLNGVNVGAELAASYAAANGQGTYANGTVVVANIANLNFNNTATINVSAVANGHQTNVAFSVNTTAVATNAGSIVDYSAVATANQSVFTMSANGSAAAYVIVTINGLLQLPGTDYSIVNNALTFTSNLTINDIIDARIFTTGVQSVGGGGGGSTPGGANTWVQFNDSGQFGASQNLAFNKANNTLSILSGNIIVNEINVVNVLSAAYTAANLGQNTVAISANYAGTLAAQQLNFNNSNSTQVVIQSVGNGNANITFYNDVILMVPMGSINIAAPVNNGVSQSAIVVGNAQAYLRVPKAFTLKTVSASVLQQSISGNVAVQIRDNGTNVLSTMITINSSSNTSIAASQQPVVNAALTSIAYNDLLFFDVISAGTNAIGLCVTLIGNG